MLAAEEEQLTVLSRKVTLDKMAEKLLEVADADA